MKKTFNAGLLIIFAVLLAGCNNYFHELIPPDGNLILSFSVEGQIGKSVITDNSINVIIGRETDITAVIPSIQISPKATLFPLTINYLKEIFPSIDIFQATVELHKAQNLTVYLEELIRDNPDFRIPVLDKPIDFSGPVNFIVMSGQGSIRQYKATIEIDTGEPHLFSFGFYKYDNPELIHDAVTYVNENAKTIQSTVLYPAEMHYLSYELIPVFEILGDRIEVDGMEVRSSIDLIKFSQGVGTKTKTVTVWREGVYADFTLTAVFSEDPDSIRSITDFRFNKTDNPGIAANAVASIINNDSLGTINIQVFYIGAKPILLNPRFISPGTVSVSGAVQTSGSNTHDFSTQMEYRVVSRNNKYTRLYTVFVDFVDIASASPVISSFKFSAILNHELTDDSQAVISDASGQIMITAKYRGVSAPETLTAEFSATGIVTVNSAVQTSGFSAQNYLRQVKYTVSNPENPLLKRDYWVLVSFSRDTSSDAAITSFNFHPDENAGLNEELSGKIDNIAGKITIFAPIGSGVSARTMYPRFTAAGQVSVNSVTQSSGASGRLFDAPVIYRVVSANGINAREYTVSVRELRSTIFVDLNAHGEGDGTSWKDAFRYLEDACNAAAEFDDDIPKEIWIAKGTYKPGNNAADYFLLTANTSYLGGFAGNETSKSERNAESNPVIISGDLDGGAYSWNLFGNFYSDNTAQFINGDAVFDNLTFINANAGGNGDRNNGGAINAAHSSDKELRVTNCVFNNLQSAGSGAAVFAQGGDIHISNSSFTDCSSTSSGGALHFNGTGNAEITNVSIISITGGAIFNEGHMLTITDSEIKNLKICYYSIYSSGGMQADTVNLQNIGVHGIYVTGGALNLSNINVNNAGDGGVYFGHYSYRAVIENSIFNDCGVISIEDSSSLDIINTKITNVKGFWTGRGGLRAFSNGNIYIDNVTVENVPSGAGILISAGSGAVNIINSSVKNTSGEGIFISSAGSVEISNTEIEYTSGNGGIRNIGNNLKIINTNVKNATGSYGIFSNRDIEIDGMELQNISGQGIYVTGGAMNISGVNASNISGRSIYFSSSLYSAVIKNSNFDRCGDVYIFNSSSVLISNTNIINLNNNVDNALYARSSGGGSINIEQVTIDGVPAGRGISVNTSGLISIRNSTIKNTKTNSSGGGIYLIGGGSTEIIDTIIENIEAGGDRGGIYYSGYEDGSSIILQRVEFRNIITAGRGGALWFGDSSTSTKELNIVISDCIFYNTHASGEIAHGWGGAIAITILGDVSISYCTFIDTSSVGSGGAISISNASMININNCNFINTVSGNNRGNAIYISSSISSSNIFITGNNYNGIPNSVIHGSTIVP